VSGQVKTRVVPGTETAPQAGYVPVNGLQLYYEIHGAGGIPLLPHGVLFNIHLHIGQLVPGIAATRQVFATDLQGHGRTGDKRRRRPKLDPARSVALVNQIDRKLWEGCPASRSPGDRRSSPGATASAT
jgi:pimeloyl-ACP methyl ester carboxylesterase